MTAADDGVPPLPETARVVNIGLPLFADAVARQGFAVVNVDWRIPAGGDPVLVAALARLYGPKATAVDAANAEVVRRLDTGAPKAIGVRPAGRGRSGPRGDDAPPLRAAHRLRRRHRPPATVDARRGGRRGVGRRHRRRRPAAGRWSGRAGAREPPRRVRPHGDGHRAVAAGVGRRERGGREHGVRPCEPGTGRDRVVRSRDACRDRAAAVPGRGRRPAARRRRAIARADRRHEHRRPGPAHGRRRARPPPGEHQPDAA